MDSTRFTHSDLRSSTETVVPSEAFAQRPLGSGMQQWDLAFPETCEKCVTECTKPSCSAVKLTAQCTDQCVIVPCSNFTHAGASCQGAANNEATTNCTDCTGLEELFKCCDDHYRSFSFCTDPPQPPFSWDSPLDHLFCGCSPKAAEEMERNFDSLSAARSPSSDTDSTNFPLSVMVTPNDPTPTTSHHSPIQHSTYVPNNSTLNAMLPRESLPVTVKCMWGDGAVSLPDLSELVGNLQHLRPPSPLPSSPHECLGNNPCRWKSCRQIFPSCEELTEHIVSFHVGAGRARYECFWEGCNRHGDRGFASKQKICRHLQSHTGHRPFQCKICKQNFSEAATLQQHMRRHTQEKPYVCDFPGCGKRFAITGALTIHKRTHNGNKPFKCSYCDRAFAESSNLSKHLRIHTGVRPYVCAEEGCGKSFARPDQLNRHSGVHQKKLR